MADSIHLVHGDSAGSALRALGVGPVRVRKDLLTFGPCDIDPRRHRALRMCHWRIGEDEAVAGLIGVSDLGAALGDAPIVLWTTAAWSDRCFTWCTLDALETLRVPRDRVKVAQAGGPAPTSSMGGLTADELREALAAAAPLDDAMASEGAALWRLYAGSSPLPFDEARRRGSNAYPELTRVGEAHAAWFPWIDGDRLRLSDVDALLLGWLGEEPQSARDLLNGPRGRDIVDKVFPVIGDTGVFERLEAWRMVGAVELERPDPNSWTRMTACITSTGERLRERGAASVRAFAPVWIGGCLVNDPSMPIVRDAADGSLSLRRPGGPS